MKEKNTPIEVSRRQIFRTIAIILGITAVTTVSLWRTTGHAEDTSAQQRTTVSVARVQITDLQQELELPGEFRPFQEVDIDTKVKGYIKTLPVDVGTRVTAGQLLVQLEIPEAGENLQSITAEVERAKQRELQSQALANNAKAMFDRLAAVSKERPDLVAQQDIEQAKDKSDAAIAAAIADRSAVTEAQAQQHEFRDIVSYEKITAPFTGIVTKLYANLGALVGESGSRGDHTGSSVMHLAQLDRLRLVIKIPESAVPVVHEGSLVHVAIPALQKNIDLKISRMSHDIDLSTRTMHVEVDYPNSDTSVTPGLYADVKLPIATHKHVLAVPVQALSARKENNANVYVLRSDGSIESRAVTLGIVTATEAEICQGLKEKEMVVMSEVPRHIANRLFKPQFFSAQD